jgi:hypothetical protein
VVVEGLRFFGGFGNVVDFYYDFKFAPAGFLDLEGGAGLDVFDYWEGVSVTFFCLAVVEPYFCWDLVWSREA